MQAPLEPSCRTSAKVAVGLAALVVGMAVCKAGKCVAAPQCQDTRTVVEISLVGRAAKDPTLASRITSWFEEKRFCVSIRTSPKVESNRILAPANAGTVHIWVSIGTNDVAHLYFATSSKSTQRPTYLVRDLPLKHGLDEMGAEHIGQVLHLSAVAIVGGQAATLRQDVVQKLQADSDSDAPVATATVPSDTEPKRGIEGSAVNDPSQRIEVAIGYGVGFHGDEGVWHGPRASLEGYLRNAFGIGAILCTAMPNSSAVGTVIQRIEALGLQSFAAYHSRITPSFDVFAYAGPGLEIVHHVPTKASDPDVTLAPGQTDIRPNLVAGLGFRLGEAPPRFAFVFEGTALFSESRYLLLDRRRYDVSATAAGFAPGAAVEIRF